MKSLLKMELYEMKHDYICMLMIIISLMEGIFFCNGYIENTYFNITEGGYEVFINMLYDSTANIILMSVFSALLVGNSFKNRTIQLKIMNGNNRLKVFLSKSISVLLISVIAMIIYPLSGSLIVTITHGWNMEILSSFYILIKILICTVLLDCSIFSVAILVGVIFRDNAKTIAVTAIVVFTNALYLAYCKNLNLPVAMHPMKLLRTVLESNSISQCILYSLYSLFILCGILGSGYTIFSKCELK